MNKYQEALNKLCQNCYLYNDNCECHFNAMLKKNNKDCQFKNTLQELVDRLTKKSETNENEYDE
jgi:hypothetical protein